MGNANAKPHPKPRNKKQVRWRAAERPSPPGRPSLLRENGMLPDLIHICWQKPEKDGGSPVILYLVEHRRVGSPHWIKSSSLPVIATELAVNDLEPGWRYQFRIRAQNAVGLSDFSEISDPFTVILQRSAITAPKFTQELKDTIVLEDSKVEFEVHFLGQPTPSICWFRDGFEIFSSNRIRIMTVSDKSILTILQTTIADEGEIKCTGTNKAGHVSTKSKLIVEAPPSIRLPKSYQDQDGIIFEIGETITLSVYVGGRPIPLVFWSHDGESIQNDDRHELEYSDKTATLKIENSIRQDRGEYQIKAVNKLSEDLASFLVTITDKPTPPGKARVLLTSGRSVTLSWSTPEDDGGCKIGNYIIEYYRVGWNVWLKAATCRQVTTMLGDLIEGSQYKFRVKAESPYGVSDPSEESEIIFIPDIRRGMINPSDISKQKGEQSYLTSEIDRTRRASSSPRVSFSLNENTPVRPERKKTGKTPEASPRLKRKQLPSIRNQRKNYSFSFEGLASSQNQTPSSPEKIIEQTFSVYPQKESFIQNTSKRSPTISLTRHKTPEFSENLSDSLQITSMKGERKSPSPEILITDAAIENKKNFISTSVSNTPNGSPNERRRSFSDSIDIERRNELKFSSEKVLGSAAKGMSSIENGENRIRPPLTRQEFSGSSEFMLVLCPEGEQGAQLRKLGIEFEEDSIPPPLSLSAPELGSEPAQQPLLKRSSSSSELLNYHLMERLKDAVSDEQEKSEVERNEELSKKISLDIPTIQINSKPTHELLVSDKMPLTNRRLSIEIVSKHQPRWSHRRQSLKTAMDINSMKENRLHRFQETEENRREKMEYRLQTELEFQREDNLKTNEKRNESVDDWMKDYEESITSEEDVNSSSDEAVNSNISQRTMHDDEEEEETYNPRNRMVRTVKASNDEPFEILTVRKDPPDVSIIPRPILKKKISSINKNSIFPITDVNVKRKRSLSLTEYSSIHEPIPFSHPNKNSQQNISQQSNTSIYPEELQVSEIKKSPNNVKRRSFSLIPSQANKLKETFKSRNLKDVPPSNKEVNSLKTVSALANFTKIAGADLIVSEKTVNNKESAEEAMVTVDFYGDIVKSFGGKTKPIAEFSKSSNSKYDTFEERKLSEIKPNAERLFQNETKYQISSINESKRVEPSSFDKNEEQVSAQSVYSTKNSSSQWKAHNDGMENQIPKPLGSFRQHYVSDRPQIDLTSHQVRNSFQSNNGRTSYEDLQNEGINISPTRSRRISPKEDTASSQKRQSYGKRRIENSRSRSSSVTTKRKTRSRDASTSPVRFQYWETESTSRHSLDSDYYKTGSITSSRSSSLNRRSLSPMRPTLREITTQTSFRVEPQTPADVLRKQVELATKADKRMRGIFEYFTDLAMVSLASWLYIFYNEYLAIPILFILVYRQLSEKMGKFRQYVKRHLPSWILKKFKWKDGEFQP